MSSDACVITPVENSHERNPNNNSLSRKRLGVIEPVGDTYNNNNNTTLCKRHKNEDEVYDSEATESDDEQANWTRNEYTTGNIAQTPYRTDEHEPTEQLLKTAFSSPYTFVVAQTNEPRSIDNVWSTSNYNSLTTQINRDKAVTSLLPSTEEQFVGDILHPPKAALEMAQEVLFVMRNSRLLSTEGTRGIGNGPHRFTEEAPYSPTYYIPLVTPATEELLDEHKQGSKRELKICSNSGCANTVQFLAGGQHGVCAKHGGYLMCTISGCTKMRFFAKGGIRKVCGDHGGKPQCIKDGCTLLQARSKKGLARPNEFFCSFHGKEKMELLKKLNGTHPANLYHYYACIIDTTEHKCSNARPIPGTFSIPICAFEWHYHNRPNLSKNELITKWSVEQQQKIEAELTSVFTGVLAEFMFSNGGISVSLRFDSSVRMQSQ
jgi:hypothetical protein